MERSRDGPSWSSKPPCPAGRNVRDLALTAEEFRRMLDASPDDLEPALTCADHTGMRMEEVLGLTWDRVDLKCGFIRLKEVDANAGERRSVPIG